MNKIFFLLLCIPFSGLAQVGIGTTNPINGSILDINSGSAENLSVRFPLVKLDSITDTMGFSSHQAGFVAYNIKDTLDVTPGLYQNNGSRWLRLITEDDLDYAYDVMDSDITLTSSDTFIELLSVSYQSSEFVKINVNLAGSGFVGSLQAIAINVSIRDSGGNEIQNFSIAPHVQDRSNIGTAVGWSASIANHPIQISTYIPGATYTFVVQTKILWLSGTKQIDISAASHPYHLGSLYVENL